MEQFTIYGYGFCKDLNNRMMISLPLNPRKIYLKTWINEQRVGLNINHDSTSILFAGWWWGYLRERERESLLELQTIL